MTTTMLRPTATLVAGGLDAPVESGDITLDETWSPYGQGTLQVPMDAPDAIPIDPRNGDRAQISASVDDTLTRTFNLGIRSRVFDYESRVCTLTVATDEALLQDYAPLADDGSPWGYQTSLRSLINYVLGLVIAPGTTLDGDPPSDADVTAYWPLTNLMTNPSVANTASGYSAGTNTAAAARSTDYGWVGNSSIRWTSSAAGEAFLHCRSFPVTPGRSYVMSCYLSTTAGRTARLLARWRDTDGNVLSDRYSPTVTAIGAGSWVRAVFIVTAPEGASNLSFNVAANTGAAGQAWYGDGFLLHEGNREQPYWDGSTAPAGYVTSWDDTAHASSSQRTPLRELDPGLLLWNAGVTAWDFLQPLLTAASLRLFCDELRVWRLVPEEYDIPDAITVSGASVTSGEDVISRADVSLWCVGVVVRYAWTVAATGLRREKIDSAGSAGRVLVVNYDRPYPGPGAAAAILSRMGKRGRQQMVTMLTRQRAAPGMQTRTTLPDQSLLVGRLRYVTFDLATGLMDMASRQQSELPPDSWGGANQATRWMDVPGTTTWANYTP